MEVNCSTDKTDKRPDLLTNSKTALFTGAGQWRRGDKKRGKTGATEKKLEEAEEAVPYSRAVSALVSC